MKANIAHKSLFAFFLAVLIDQGHKLYMLNIMGWTGGEIITVTPFFLIMFWLGIPAFLMAGWEIHRLLFWSG